MHWLQNPNQNTIDNPNNVRREINRHIRNKKKEYLQVVIYELETHSKAKNTWDLCRCIIDFKKFYQTRINTV